MFKPHNPTFFLTACLMGLLLFQNANAQIAPSFYISTEPLPIFAGDTAVVTIIPNNFTLASTTFQWYINGTLNSSASGMGRSSILVKTPDKQEIITIKVIVDPGPGFDKIERQTIIATIPPFQPIQDMQKNINKIKNDFSIIAIPPDPSPGQAVHLNIQAVGFDTDRTKIQWFINDKSVLSGVGEKNYDFEAGKLGETHKVRVNITLLDGTTNSQTQIIRVNDLSYYWWTDAVTPPWYKGKSLPSVHSRVTILALPEIAGANANNLIYKWLFNDGPVVNKSGFGKSTYSFSLQFQGITENISVRAETLSGTAKKEKNIYIKTAAPNIKFYQIRPLEGANYSQNVSFFEAAPASILDFAAELFFFPQTSVPDLSFRWQLNGKNVPSKEPASPNIISIRSEGGQIPEQFVQLNVENKKIRNGGAVSNSFRLKYR